MQVTPVLAVSCPHGDKADWIAAVKKLCVVEWSMDWAVLSCCERFISPCTGKLWLDVVFEVRMKLGNANFTFDAYFDGKVRGRCTARYPDS